MVRESRREALDWSDVHYNREPGMRFPRYHYHPRDPRDNYSLLSGFSDGRRRQKKVGWDFSDMNSTGSTRYGYSTDGYAHAAHTSRSARARYSYAPVEPLYGRNSFVRPYRAPDSDTDNARNYSRRARHLLQPDTVGRQYDESATRANVRSGGHIYRRVTHGNLNRDRRETAGADYTSPRLEYESQERKTADDEESEDQIVDQCCGCVDIVVTSCCWGTEVVTCRYHDSSAEEKDSAEETTESVIEETTSDKTETDESDDDIDDETSEGRWASPRRRPPAVMPTFKQKIKPEAEATKQVKSSPKDPRVYEEYSTGDSSDLSDSSDALTSVHSCNDATPPDKNINTKVTMSTRKIFLREKVELEIEPNPTETTPVVFLPKPPKPAETKPPQRNARTPKAKYIGEKPKLDNYKTAILSDIDPVDGPFVDGVADNPLHIRDTIHRERELIMYKPEPEIPPPYKHKPIPPRPMFPLKKLPKREAVMVRVGGGWMNVEHHRKRRIPLEIQEHHRSVTNDKYLTIRSKFTTNKEHIPVAYTKYRDKAVWLKKKET
ncbi:uncharacterized protein LOC110452332 [Mizuhopecten yessoensis]|uniref:GAR domain-containing protein n=1 Tax=Mizuhopecten yessoensis TaxID=6573 RepID=A0A210QJS2_MIZYE|nr:uncharacterized protein LOC110452332 [Mizuhopecten yessoensis]OWF49008.1 hypothetical protein KP79_PYT06955 [Mizuhopecten yessoensis]